MTTTANLVLPNIDAAQSQKHVTHNAGLQILDMLIHAAVISRVITTPPGSPTEGDRYLVPASPTGAWIGHTNHVAGFYGGGWIFGIPKVGWRIWSVADSAYYSYNGSAWGPDGATGSFSILGVNATADATNKLSVNSSAILLNNIGNGIQVKLNKNALTDTASFLFQTGFSGRAEFGTTGDDNFTLKVSADGSTFFTGLKILAANGRVAKKALAVGLTAAGTTQATALALTNSINEFTTVAAGTGGILPTPEPGEDTFVANAGANALLIYPPVGGSIDALATNAGFSVPAGTRNIFTATSATKYYSK